MNVSMKHVREVFGGGVMVIMLLGIVSELVGMPIQRTNKNLNQNKVPWLATKETDGLPPKGHIAAWMDRVPPPQFERVPAGGRGPDPFAEPPRRNPGGVNGDRSPRR